MRRRMVVADVTRMHGDKVCVGGYLDDGTPIRPICKGNGPTEEWLRPTSDIQIRPFSEVELEIEPTPIGIVRPHTEDRFVPNSGHRVIGELALESRPEWLNRILSPEVRAIFGAEVHAAPDGMWGRYVRSGEGERSLGTIRVSSVTAVLYQFYPNAHRWDYRLRFVDGSREEFQLPVVDLAYRNALDAMRDQGYSLGQITSKTLAELRRKMVYLRIGLARGWDRHPDRCYLQITGVYGFSVTGEN